jgi:ATP-binding cassette subfamily C (CFTR/MRP) protein 1
VSHLGAHSGANICCGEELANTFLDSAPKTSSNALLAAILKTIFPSFIAPFLPRVLLLGFVFAQPFLIERSLLFLAAPEGPDSNNIGYGLIGAYVLTYSGVAVRYSL